MNNKEKIEWTAKVFKAIVDHIRFGGTYRYLIYDRLGFGVDAYVPLCNDGLYISNAIFDLRKYEGKEKRELIKPFRYGVLLLQSF